MKYNFGGNNLIEFKTDMPGLEKFSPVKPAKFFFPQWFKSMKDYVERDANHEKGKPDFFGKKGKIAQKWTNATVKRCPAIVDVMGEGYVIPMWTDFLIQRNKEYLEWDNKLNEWGIEFHNNNQISDWPLKKTDFPEAVKFINPWRIYTPPGYSVLFMQPFYQFERRFTVLPGIVETDSYHHVHFPTIWHSTKDVIIDRGTPFMQVIPFKRENWDFEVGQMSEDQKDKDFAEKVEINTVFKHSLRKITQRNKKD